MENQRIRNATPKEFAGIKFKSLSEVAVYKLLLQSGLSPEYEAHTYTLWEKYIPLVPFYTKNTFSRKNKYVKVLSSKTVMDMRPLHPITYTPDFYFEYGGKKIIVEVKGLENDVFPYKFKMFRQHIATLPDAQNYEIWEIFTQSQLKELITRLKNDCNQELQGHQSTHH